MEAVEAILTRRSVRHYLLKSVPDSRVEELLRAAMAAPSAGNQQPWHFVVIRDRGILDEIPNVHPFARMLPEASVAILVCAETHNLKWPQYWEQDCAAATQNLLLSAHALGLGAVWIGLHPHDDRVRAIRRLLTLPDAIVPFSLIPVGYPAEVIPPASRFDPSRIHHDHW